MIHVLDDVIEQYLTKQEKESDLIDTKKVNAMLRLSTHLVVRQPVMDKDVILDKAIRPFLTRAFVRETL